MLSCQFPLSMISLCIEYLGPYFPQSKLLLKHFQLFNLVTRLVKFAFLPKPQDWSLTFRASQMAAPVKYNDHLAVQLLWA